MALFFHNSFKQLRFVVLLKAIINQNLPIWFHLIAFVVLLCWSRTDFWLGMEYPEFWRWRRVPQCLDLKFDGLPSSLQNDKPTLNRTAIGKTQIGLAVHTKWSTCAPCSHCGTQHHFHWYNFELFKKSINKNLQYESRSNSSRYSPITFYDAIMNSIRNDAGSSQVLLIPSCKCKSPNFSREFLFDFSFLSASDQRSSEKWKKFTRVHVCLVVSCSWLYCDRCTLHPNRRCDSSPESSGESKYTRLQWYVIYLVYWTRQRVQYSLLLLLFFQHLFDFGREITEFKHNSNNKIPTF